MGGGIPSGLSCVAQIFVNAESIDRVELSCCEQELLCHRLWRHLVHLQPLLSIASFVLFILVVRPSMATIPAAADLADASDEVVLPDLS